jgi:hypothetical protein
MRREMKAPDTTEAQIAEAIVWGMGIGLTIVAVVIG